MKKLIFAAVVTLFSLCSYAQGSTYVNGYTKSNGTYVQGHYRTLPNNTVYDNWSTVGNVNPYTGVSGTKYPESSNSYSTPTYSTPSYNSYSTPTYSTPSYNSYSTSTYSIPSTNIYSTPTYSIPSYNSYSLPSSSYNLYTTPITSSSSYNYWKY